MERPAFLDRLRTRTLTETAVDSFGSNLPPHVSIRANKFRLVDAAGQEKIIGDTLDVVIIDLNPKMTRMFYGRDYQEDDTGPPKCWSDNGIGPSIQAREPQAPTCASCPNAAWGSKISKVSGKPIPACAEGIKLAVVPTAGEKMTFMLRVPPNSIVPFREFAKVCKGHKVEFTEIVTRLTFSDDQQGTLGFAPLDYLKDESVGEYILSVWESGATEALVGKTDKPRPAGELPAPAAQQTLQAIARPEQQLPPPPKPTEFAPLPQGGEKKKVGRPKKAEAAPADDSLDIPPFLKRQASAGMQTPQAAPDNLAADLEKAFALPTAAK
jgi:cell division protein FtsZ